MPLFRHPNLLRLLTAATVAMLVAAVGLIAWMDYRAARSQGEAEAQRITEMVYRHALTVFQTHELVAERVREYVAPLPWNRIDGSRDLRRYLADVRSHFTESESIWLADAEGRVRNASEALPGRPVTVQNRDFFQRLRDQPLHHAIGERAPSLSNGRWNFSTALRRETGSGAFDGTVIVTVSADAFRSIWSPALGSPDDMVALIRLDGSCLVSLPDVDDHTPVLPPEHPLMRLTKTATTGSFLVTDADGVERFYGFRRLPHHEVAVMYGRSTASMMAAWRTKALLLAGMLAFGGLLLLSFWLLRRASERSAELAQLSAVNRHLEIQAVRDPLTGLFNRRYLDETLPRELASARRHGYELSVIMLDIDHFKRINDAHGHRVGDVILERIGEVLARGCRAEDIACRYGGEEFTLILPRAGIELAMQRAEELRRAVAALRVSIDNDDLRVTMTAGVATCPMHAATVESLIRHADAALYGAKAAGRNRVQSAATAGATTT